MDKLVAKALGLRIIHGDPKAKSVFGRLDGIECNEDSLFWDPNAVHNVIPSFSTNDETALRVLMWLRNSGSFCCINISSDYNYWWDMEAYPNTLDQLLKTKKEPKHRPCARVNTESFAHGICLLLLEGMKFVKRGKKS